MMVFSRETKIPAEKIMDRARKYFEGEFGLKISNHVSSCCAEFYSEIAQVSIQILNKGSQNEVILTSREFDYQVQAFARTLD